MNGTQAAQSILVEFWVEDKESPAGRFLIALDLLQAPALGRPYVFPRLDRTYVVSGSFSISPKLQTRRTEHELATNRNGA